MRVTNIYKEFKGDLYENKDNEEKKYVMLIENLKVIRNILIKKFNESGYEVLISETPLDSFQRIILEPIDILITSKEFENLDGLTLIKILKCIPQRNIVKTIFLTSYKINSEIPDFILIKDYNFMKNFDEVFEKVK